MRSISPTILASAGTLARQPPSDRALGHGEEVMGRGLGIVSMRERLKLVDGELSSYSREQKGTEIRATIRLHPFGRSAGVGKI